MIEGWEGSEEVRGCQKPDVEGLGAQSGEWARESTSLGWEDKEDVPGLGEEMGRVGGCYDPLDDAGCN